MLVLATAPGVEQLCPFTTSLTVVVVARTVVDVARAVVDVARAVVNVGGVVVGVLVVGVVVVSVVAAAIVVRTTLVVGFDGVPFVLLPQPVSRRADVKTTSATPETYPLSCLNQTTLSPGRSEVARVYTLGRHNEGRSDAADGGPGIGETDHRVQCNCVQLQRFGRVLELAQARGSAGLRRDEAAATAGVNFALNRARATRGGFEERRDSTMLMRSAVSIATTTLRGRPREFTPHQRSPRCCAAPRWPCH